MCIYYIYWIRKYFNCDLLKNDRKKFLEMMEWLAKHWMQREEAANEQYDYEKDDNEYEDDYEEDGEEVWIIHKTYTNHTT